MPFSTKEKRRANDFKKRDKILEYRRDYYFKNKDVIDSQNKDYRHRYKEKVARKRREYSLKKREKIAQYKKEYSIKNRVRINEYRRLYNNKKRLNDIHFYLKELMRTRLNQALKRKTKTGSAIKDMGCTIEELKNHIESKFIDGMSWLNKGQWHLDHILPISKFDLTNRDEFLKAVHYTNIQPLWAVDNRKKVTNERTLLPNHL